MKFKTWWKTYAPKERIDMLEGTAKDAFSAGLAHAVEILENEKSVLERHKLEANAGIVSGLIDAIKAEIPESI